MQASRADTQQNRQHVPSAMAQTGSLYLDFGQQTQNVDHLAGVTLYL